MRIRPRCFAALVVSLFLPLLASAQNPRTSTAFERAAHLQHGINTSMWFAQASDYSPQRLRSFTTADDIALIAKMGFDHCRLSIDGDQLMTWFYTQRDVHHSTGFMEALDRVVKTMLDNHLSVIIDVHPTSQFKAELFQGAGGIGNFVELWRALAGHYAAADPEHVFFEIMNESEQQDPWRWHGIEAQVVQAIRQVAPDNTIIASGAHWSGLPDLLATETLADDNVIYTFHDYEPFPFTHQGATWTNPEVRPERAIPYPSTPENIAPKLNQEPDLAGQYFLDEYGENRWDAARVENSIEFAAKWSALHHAPVYCGEFGVFREFAPPAARAQWLHDMRTAMEKNHIGWAMWDYQGGFSVVTKENGVTTPDRAILNALGLHMP
ncbi:MAG TPA: cellulase family glycosylhydrolase [Acidobacteriaceae bacterium]|nr:cellulase family glycosylhydrolase [Acidobacteriaceae bacterium]